MKRKLKITGTPNDKDEVNKREVYECEGWVWDLDVIGSPSRLRLIHRLTEDVTPLGFDLWEEHRVAEVEESTGRFRKITPEDV
jgi:hypothetical protein